MGVILTVLVSVRRPNLTVNGTKNLVGGSRLYKIGEVSWTLRHVHCCFLTVDVMSPVSYFKLPDGLHLEL